MALRYTARRNDYGLRQPEVGTGVAVTKRQTQVKEFPGLCIYYWRFTAGFADTVKLLTHSGKKSRLLSGTQKQKLPSDP
jgi:hypothetical protein